MKIPTSFRNRANYLLLSLLLSAASFTASATLLGDDVTLTVFDSGTAIVASFCPPGGQTATVSAVIEFNVCETSEIFADVGASTIMMSAIGDFPLFGDFDFVFSDLDWIGESGRIIDVALGGLGTATFTDDSVTISLSSGSLLTADPFTTVRIVTEHVPEPTSLSLLALGMVGFGAQRRRRQSS